jgi:xanthine dehydrogenase accessory factor
VVASQGIWDEEAVGLALTREVSYVGLIASPTRAAVVRDWLREETTVGDERIAALRAPAGLDLGAETAEEVALSILAELVQVRRGRADFVASPGPATVAAGIPAIVTLDPVVDDIVLLDPVCGMTVERATARHLAEHDGVIYAFCSIGCRTRFIKEPATYLAASAPSGMPD